MAEFNLIDEPWIPSTDLQGNRREYGIRDILFKAHELREICDDSPLVTVALHRLLLAILYRSHTGPRTFADWRILYARGACSPKAVTQYLDKWHACFDLFADARPFFQMGGLETTNAVSVSRLATESASGNNATLFDHSADDSDVAWPPAQAARRLVACQSFALGFGKSGNATIDGKDEAMPYSADAVALRGMSVWAQGTTLFETLCINLAPGDDASLPPWELENPHAYRDRLKGKGRKAVASLGVIDRLTWQSRLVRLLPNNGTVSRMFFTQGRSADKSPGDPMKVYRTSKEEGPSALPLGSRKAAWRDAHSIFMIPSAGSNERRPDCFNLVARARSTEAALASKSFATHVVGLASAPNKAGKFLLWRHERMPVPGSMLGNAALIERVGGLLQAAECVASELNARTRRIARLYLSPDCESPAGRPPDKDEVTKLVDAIDPRSAYWARLENRFLTLLADLPNDWDAGNSDWKPGNQQVATWAWREHVKREAVHALVEAVRSLGTTARAIQAVARVRTDFYDSDLNPPAQKAPKEPKPTKAKEKGGKNK